MYFHVRRSGEGLDLASSLEEKFGIRLPNKMKNLGSSGTTRGKNLDIVPVKENLIFFVQMLHVLLMLQENTLFMRIHRCTTQILGSYLKFKGQNFGYLSPIFW